MIKPRLAIALFAALSLALCVPSSAQTPAGTAFDYQGRLSENGAPADGSYDFQFTLWDAAAGGAQIGPTLDLAGVAVVEGLFTTSLDFGAESFDADARWLQIAVGPAARGGLTPLAPRRRVQPTTQAQYADRAASADSAITASSAFIAQSATTADSATTAQSAQTAVSAQSAANADTLDGLDSTDFDMSALNELNVAFSLAGTILSLEDAGGAMQVDLAPLVTRPPTPPRQRVATVTAVLQGANAGEYEFDAYSVSWGWEVGTGGSGGGTPLARGPFVFEKKSDAASPFLRQTMAGTIFIPELVFEIENDAGAPITLTGKNCLITDISTDFDGDAEIYERYELTYIDVRLRYPDATTPIEAEIDFAASSLNFSTPAAGTFSPFTNAIVAAPVGLVDAAIPAGDRILAYEDGSSQAIMFMGGNPMGGSRLEPNGVATREWTYEAAIDFHRMALGTPIDTYTFDFYREDNETPAGVRRHERIEFGAVLLHGFEIEAEEPGAPLAKVTLGRPDTIAWTYYPVNGAGQPLPPVVSGWNILTGMPLR